MIIFICSVHGNFDSFECTNGIIDVVSSGHETTLTEIFIVATRKWCEFYENYRRV